MPSQEKLLRNFSGTPEKRMMKLFVDMMSQPSRAVMLFCNATRISYTRSLVQITKGETRQEEFLAINPRGQVPVIQEEDGFVLNESHAIMKYLGAKHGVADHWYPKDLRSRARVDAALDYHHTVVRPICVGIFWNSYVMPLMGKEGNPKIIKSNENRLGDMLEVLREMTHDGERFVAGVDVSIADLSILCDLKQLEVLPKDYFSEYPFARKWAHKIQNHHELAPVWDDVHKVFNIVMSKSKQPAKL